MKPTTDEVLAWAKEIYLYDKWNAAQLDRLESFATLAYAAGAAAMKERCVDAVPPQYFELRDRIRALGDDDA